MFLVWLGPGVLRGSWGTVYPGERINETRHDPKVIRQWIAEGHAEYRSR